MVGERAAGTGTVCVLVVCVGLFQLRVVEDLGGCRQRSFLRQKGNSSSCRGILSFNSLVYIKSRSYEN